jgi:hypothetical protein
MSNNKSYKILKDSISGDTYIHYYFYRNDGNLVYRYNGNFDSTKCQDGEYVEYNFAANDSGIWPICYNNFGASNKSCIHTFLEMNDMVQNSVEHKTFVYVTIAPNDTIWSPMPTEIDEITKNIGITTIGGEGAAWYLFAAILNVKTYGRSVGVNDKKYIPQTYSLSQNFPNPFNPSTTINYSLPHSGNVKLTVYNSIGSKVATIVNEYKPAGNYSVQFNASNLASGIYLYRLESGSFTSAKKLTLLK